MEIFILLMVAIIQTDQVHSEIFGSRVPGDYHLGELTTAGSPNLDFLGYPVGYPNKTRPEIISYIVTNPLPGGYEAYLKYGIGYTHYYQFVVQSHIQNASVYGVPPIETSTTGSLSIQDDQLHTETFTKNALPNKIIVINFKYPRVGRAATINWLSVKDNINNDPSSIKIVQGGVGFNIARIQIKSRDGQGLNMTIQIYGTDLTVDSWPWYVRHDGATDALLIKKYWVFEDFIPPPVKRNCGCRSGLMITPREK